MIILNLEDKNTFYAPASDECWVILAKEIMSSYTLSYIHQFPTDARSQLEYDKLDKQKFAPQRKSILRRIKNGPLRSVVDIHAVYSALNQKRLEHKRSWGVYWKDNYEDDLDNL